jgi:hypothetical protein
MWKDTSGLARQVAAPITAFTFQMVDGFPMPLGLVVSRTALTNSAVMPAVTTGLFSMTYPDIDAVLDIEPLIFMTPLHQTNDNTDSTLAHPNFQPYISQALVSFKADKDQGKRPQFDGVHMPPWNPWPASVTEEIISPAIRASWTIPASSSLRLETPTPASAHIIPQSLPPSFPKSNIPNHFETANTSAPVPSRQFRYVCPIEDKTTPCHILDKVMETTVSIPVKDLLSVAPEFHKHLRELATTKHIPVTTNIVQVNELSGCDPDAVS